MTPSNPIPDFLSRVALAPSQSHKALTVWPLVWPEGVEPVGPACVPLRRAMAQGTVRIDEIGDHGSVPHVQLVNEGPEAVLFLFGEEILGAKQNRVANATFLVAPGSRVVLDVSCVEAGRWSRRSPRGFSRSAEAVSTALRQRMLGRVRASVSRGQGFQADQSEVWAEIRKRLGRTPRGSSTSAWSDYRESRRRDLEEMDRAFRPVERQVGFVAMTGGEVAGLEAVGRSEVLTETFRTLLRSYTIDATDEAQLRERETEAGRSRFEAPEPFLAALREAPATRAASRGLGDDLRVGTDRVSACALDCEGLVHLTAFPAEA